MTNSCRDCKHFAKTTNEHPCSACVQGVEEAKVSMFEPSSAPAPVPGRKDDGGKLDLTLLFDDCPHALEAVAEVAQWAITKKQPVPYARGSWQGVHDFQRRYRAAQLRHQLGGAKSVLLGGEGRRFEDMRDHETGLRELAHIAIDVLFQLEMAIRREKGLPMPEGYEG